MRVTGFDIPYPPAKLEKHHLPDLDRILDGVDRAMGRPNSLSGWKDERHHVQKFRLPDLGEGLTESEILTWQVAVGDTVTLNQIIAEVETAKAVVELPSPYAGVVTRCTNSPAPSSTSASRSSPSRWRATRPRSAPTGRGAEPGRLRRRRGILRPSGTPRAQRGGPGNPRPGTG